MLLKPKHIYSSLIMVSCVALYFYLKKDEFIKNSSLNFNISENQRSIASVVKKNENDHLINSPLLSEVKKQQFNNQRVKRVKKREISGFDLKIHQRTQIKDHKGYSFVDGVQAIPKVRYETSMGKILGSKGQYFIIENLDSELGFPVVESHEHARLGIVTGELTVRWKERQDDLILIFGGEIKEEFSELNIVVYKMHDPKKVFELAKKLEGDATIKKIKPEIIEFIRTY